MAQNAEAAIKAARAYVLKNFLDSKHRVLVTEVKRIEENVTVAV